MIDARPCLAILCALSAACGPELTVVPGTGSTGDTSMPCVDQVLDCAADIDDSQLTGTSACGDPVDAVCSREASALATLQATVGEDLPWLGALWITEMGGDIGGYAFPMGDEPSTESAWEVVVIGATGAEHDHILMHEYGHAATMHDLIGAAPPFTCDVALLYGDCPAEGTLARAFIDQFWSDEVGDILADVRTRYSELDPAGEAELRQRLGAEGLACQFVTEEARVDPAEDLAETYAALALGTAEPTCGTDKMGWLAQALGGEAPVGSP